MFEPRDVNRNSLLSAEIFIYKWVGKQRPKMYPYTSCYAIFSQIQTLYQEKDIHNITHIFVKISVIGHSILICFDPANHTRKIAKICTCVSDRYIFQMPYLLFCVLNWSQHSFTAGKIYYCKTIT
jgi:hypothetical protein